MAPRPPTPLDALALEALAGELRAALVGARVQEVIQLGPLTIGLELYSGARSYLTLSASPEQEGVVWSEERFRRGAGPPTPLALSLAAHVEGLRLAEIVHPAWERVIELVFTVGDHRWRVVAELIGRLSNLVVVDEGGIVRAAARTVTEHMSRVRQVIPGRPYAMPPALRKVPPDAVTADQLKEWLNEVEGAPAWRALVANVAAASPLAAKEIVFRATGASDTPAGAELDPARLLAALADIFLTRPFQPSVARAALGAEGGAVSAYAPYMLTHLTFVEPATSMAAAIAAFSAERAGDDAYGAARAPVEASLATGLDRARRRLFSLEREAARRGDAEALKRKGELILAYQRDIVPGQSRFEAEYMPGEDPMTIELDPGITPVDNANAYFAAYRRARRAAAALPSRLEEARRRVEALQRLNGELEQAADRGAIDRVARKATAALGDSVAAAGKKATAGRSGPRTGRRSGGRPPAETRPAGPLRHTTADDFVVLIGRNSRQNEEVTFRMAAPDDTWLHVAGASGSHVIVRAAGRKVPESTILEAASAAAWFSGARQEGKSEVIVAERRHVARSPGGQPGRVTVKRFRTVVVEPRDPARGPDIDGPPDSALS